MFTHYRTRGFIVKKADSGETNCLFSVYTKDFGRLELLARSVRKIKSKLRSGLDIFYLSEIEFIQGKAYKTLTDAILIKKFENIRKDLKKLKIAYQIFEIFDNLVRGQEPDEEIWQLLKETLERLDKLEAAGQNKLKIIYYYFFWNILSLLGYRPELYHCSFCQEKISSGEIFFDLKNGGLICSQCGKKEKKENLIEVSREMIKIIRILLDRNWSVLERLKVDDKDFDLLKKVSSQSFSKI